MNHSQHLVDRFSFIEEGKKMDLSKLPNHLKSNAYRKDN